MIASPDEDIKKYPSCACPSTVLVHLPPPVISTEFGHLKYMGKLAGEYYMAQRCWERVKVTEG